MGYTLAPWAIDFMKLFVGPLAGAFAGAMTAQGIARRNATIQRQLDELRATNAAVCAANATVAAAASLKQQHVDGMKQRYDELSAARDAAHIARQEFHFQADLETLPPFRTAVPMLEKLLYERISVGRGVLGLFSIVVLSAGGANDAIEARNTAVKTLKSRAPIPAEELAEIYFGLVTSDGHADLNISSSLEGLAHSVDCVVLYGCVLAMELAKHAEGLARMNKGFPPAERVDFTALVKAGLVPKIDATDQLAFANLNVVPDLPH